MNTLSQVAHLARLLWYFKRRSVIVPAMPLRLWIESSLICNLRCVMCPNKEIAASQKGVMAFGLFTKIIDEAKDFVQDINLHHRGEPLINPNLGKMIGYAKKQGLMVRFHTNGTLLDEEKANIILDAAPDLVSVSFDGFAKDVYEEVRPGARFETTVENILRFAELKKQRGQKAPYIVIERIDFAKYRGQTEASAIAGLAQRFTEAGVNEILVKEEYAWATEEAPLLTKEQMVNMCTFPWYAMVVGWDGTVTPCPQDYRGALPLGSLAEQSIREVWNGAGYRALRSNLLEKNDQLTVCRRCDRLCRKNVSGVPLQYLVTFLADQFAGYGRLRRWIGTSERN
jgi:radical SAM protein with 4Fe4S-binding SPASM domain